MRYFICILLIVWNAGCTTMRTVESPEPEMAVHQLEIGDKVKVITADGRKLNFKVLAIDDEQVTGEVIKPGQLATDERITVPIDDIRLVSRAEFDGIKTAGAAVAGGVVLAAVSFALLMLSISSW